MKAIYKRELRSYFTTMTGYIFLAVFLAVNGLVFSVTTVLQGSESYVQNYFYYMIMAFILIIPILTMKIFAEERKSKTEQLLLTSPVSLFGIVLGKFLAAYTVFAGGIAIGCFNFAVLFMYGTPPVGVIAGSVFVMLLIGAACIAIGVFISSLTENQFIACITTMALLLVFVAASLIESSISSTVLRTIVSFAAILSRFTNFTYGIFDIASAVYYLSLAFVFLFLTVRVLERRRWN